MREEKQELEVILLVEDNPFDEELTLYALKESNVLNPVVVAHDGVEALDYLFARGSYTGRPESKTPRLVLLDLHLPKVSGIEVLQVIRADERTKDLPIVVMSAAEEREIVRAKVQGIQSFVQKPIDFAQLAKAVKDLGLFWLLLRDPE